MLSDLSNRLLAPAMALGLCIGLGLSVAGF